MSVFDLLETPGHVHPAPFGDPLHISSAPLRGLFANAQTLVLTALRRRGYVKEGGSPTLTEKGIEMALILETKL